MADEEFNPFDSRPYERAQKYPPPAPASREGDGLPEGWRERLTEFAEWLERDATPSEAFHRAFRRHDAPERRLDAADDLRAALAAASQGEGGLPADVRERAMLAGRRAARQWHEPERKVGAAVAAALDVVAAAAPPAETGGGGLPQIVEDESGDQWYVVGGHVPETVARGALYQHLLAEGCSEEEADGAACAASVTNGWWRDAKDPQDDERMLRCGPDDDGAVAITELSAREPAGPGGGLDREAAERAAAWIVPSTKDPNEHGVLVRSGAAWWLLCPADATLYLGDRLETGPGACRDPSCEWADVHDAAAALAPLLTGGGAP